MSTTLDPRADGWQRVLACVAHAAAPGELLRGTTMEPGRAFGVKHALAFGRVQLAGV